jgi:hypothetical protein
LPEERLPGINGLSPRGRSCLAELERTRLWPGAAAEALRLWTLFAREPRRRLWERDHGCGEFYCCPDPGEVREILERVAHALPPRDARAFRRRLAALDELW